MTEGRLRTVLRHPRVVIAGGGVGGLEAALALRAMAGPAVQIELVAPEAEFVYRALSVGEPFGYERALRVPLGRLEQTHAILHRRDRVTAVLPTRREVELGEGERVDYDELIVAVGARQENWLQGAVCFTGPGATPKVRDVLDDLEAGRIGSVAFAAPAADWTLPAYELALLTAGWLAERHVTEVELSVWTPEHRPLDLFGRAAARTVRDLLSDRGIRFHGGSPVPPALAGYHADAVVCLPRLVRMPVAGLPVDGEGFIPVDEHAAVRGLAHVYAVGDATDQPVKQGGLAAQQADCAASAIAAELGAPVQPATFTPVLRGLLLGGMSAAFLRRDADRDEAAFDALWWPPTKVAGHHLGPYLTDVHHHTHGTDPMEDREPPEDTEAAARDRMEVRRIAVDLARAEAGWGDHRTALRWLQTVEWLDGALPPDLARLREEWEALV